MDFARRCFLYLTAGTVLTAKYGMATAQVVPVHSTCYPQRGGGDIIVSVIRQWAAERRQRSFIGAHRMSAEDNARTMIGVGGQSSVSPTLAVIHTKTPPIDILRSWAHEKLVADRINS